MSKKKESRLKWSKSDTREGVLAAAKQKGFPVMVSISVSGREGDMPEAPCEDEATVGQFLIYWNFIDSVNQARVRHYTSAE